MKPLTIIEGIAAALLITCASFSAERILPPLSDSQAAANANVALSALLYVEYLIYRSRIRVGKLILGGACALVLAASAAFIATLPGVATIAVATLWLMRTLLYAPGFRGGLADLAVCLLGAALAAYAITNGSGLAAAVWCFFLVQALSAVLPKRAENRYAQHNCTADPDRFNRAYATAETALRRLARKS